MRNDKLKFRNFFLASLVVFCFLVVKESQAAEIQAASCEQADVQTAIDFAQSGDIVRIPEGECIWIDGITITKDLKIIGAGKESTIIMNNITPIGGGYYSYIFKFVPDETTISRLNSFGEDSEVYEISGIKFDSSSIVAYRSHLGFYNYVVDPVVRIKIHDNSFNTTSMSMTSSGYIYGVIYDNIFNNARGMKCEGGGYGGFENDPMFSGDKKGWYIEDNVYFMDNSLSNPMIASNGNRGGGWVARYNSANGINIGGGVQPFEAHGNQGDSIYGPQKIEIYGNDINVTQYSVLHVARGGKNIVFHNKYKNDDINDLVLWEEFADYMITSTDHPYPRCADSASTIQICSEDCFCQKVHSSYFFNNRSYTSSSLIGLSVDMDYECREPGSTLCITAYGSDIENYPIINNPSEIVENREFWTQHATGTFDGTGDALSGGGVGCGTLANRPTTCTAGVAYWATDQSCADLTGMAGNHPITTISGTLYKCTSTDTWEEYYKPYVYPHPLRRQFRSDLDVDDDVDIFDYNTLIGNFGVANDCNKPDVDLDCDVDIFDYSVLLGEFGSGI